VAVVKLPVAVVYSDVLLILVAPVEATVASRAILSAEPATALEAVAAF